MDEAIANRVIPYFDREGRPGRIRYGDLLIEMGEAHLVPLSECLMQEGEKVAEFNRNADRLSVKINALTSFYDEIEQNPKTFHALCSARRRDLYELPYENRIQVLNAYYTVNPTHARILRELTAHMLQGAEGDHSAHAISLMQRALDFTCRVLRHVPRKTRRASAVHAIEAARGAAKNGLRSITIIATLLHDVLEEKLDQWTEDLIDHELLDPAYGDCCGKSMREVPVALRHRIIQKHIDAFNDRASGIFFQIALTLYDHLRCIPTPARYYEALHSIMEMVAALSRRRDMSYYSYLRELLYPRPDARLDEITRARLLEELEPEFHDAGALLDEFLQNVHNFYETPLGSFAAKEEVRRNAFREILAKVFDRLNNTRDMERELGFSIPVRLYGTGFKNIFFLQALEDKLRKPSFNTEERRLIEVKFINKPKVAALYQILDDLDYLGDEITGHELIDFLQTEIDRYRGTRGFRRLTPPKKKGYFDGLIYLFNEITLGRKSNLVELEQRADKQAEVLVAFQAVLESFLVYPALLRDELASSDGGLVPNQRLYRAYRIESMGPGLELRSDARKEQAVDLLNLKTFSRRVV